MSRRSLAGAGLGILVLASAAVAIAVRCGGPPEDGSASSHATTPSLPTQEPMPSGASGASGADEPAPVSKHHPELKFVEHSEGLPAEGTWIGYPLLADFNADGRADLVASNREEDGYNAWTSSAKGPWRRCIDGLGREMMYGPARAADLNGDGKPDLILSAHSDGLRVYLNDGQMHWTQAPGKIENPFLLLDVAVGNIDGDKNPDVVGIAQFKGGFGVYLGDGKGGLRRLPESSTIVDAKIPSIAFFGRKVELVDIDGDGLDDIVAATNLGAKVYLTRKGEPMHWEDISAGLPVPPIGNALYSVVPGHFTGSKGWEIAVCMLSDPSVPAEKRDTIGVYALNDDNKSWRQIDTGLARDENYRDLRAGDMNGDGKLDLVAMSLESGCVIYLGDGHGGFTVKGRLPGVHGKGRVALGDIDGDGLLDIAIAVPADKAHPEGGGVRAFLNRPEIWQ
jgi:hypothetical protein